jgi:hypothetical protein
MTVFGYDKLESNDVKPSFLTALSQMTTVPENQIEVSTVAYSCQTVCTSAGASVGVTVNVVVTAKDSTEQAAVEQAISDLISTEVVDGDGEACCKPEFKGYFAGLLSSRTLALPTGYAVNSVAAPEYSAVEEMGVADVVPTPAPDGGGGSTGMIIGVVVAVVLVAVGAGFAYKAKTKKAVVRSVKKEKPNGGMTDNPMSLGDVYGNAGDPDVVIN